MLDVSHINLIAVILATIAGVGVGFIWFSQKIFGEKWASSIPSVEAEIQPSPWIYLINFLATLLMAYTLAQFIYFLEATTALKGLMVGFWAWLGFTFTTSITDYIYAHRPLITYAITYGYQLFSLCLMGAILGALL